MFVFFEGTGFALFASSCALDAFGSASAKGRFVRGILGHGETRVWKGMWKYMGRRIGVEELFVVVACNVVDC
jgi:hypothetical protein